MMQLGEIAAALRAANGWTLKDLAVQIRRAGASNVKHQHLQQLESKPQMRPRYVIELASAFGKSVEDFLSWEPGQPIYGPNRSTPQFDGIADSPSTTYPAQQPRLSASEQDILEAFRACSAATQKALLTIARDIAGKSN